MPTSFIIDARKSRPIYENHHKPCLFTIYFPVERSTWAPKLGYPLLFLEILIKIMTNLSGEDRRMLTQIVKKRGSLSDELKEAF
jgi:hypothetical protein